MFAGIQASYIITAMCNHSSSFPLVELFLLLCSALSVYSAYPCPQYGGVRGTITYALISIGRFPGGVRSHGAYSNVLAIPDIDQLMYSHGKG